MPAHAEHLAPRLRGSADPRRRRTVSAHPWRAAAVRRLLCFSLLLHKSVADRSNQFVQQMRRTATHVGGCTLCSLRFLFPHPRWLVPAVCPCGPLCALLEKETGRRPAGIVSPAFWAACARLRAALAGMIERLYARSILCEIKGGGRKRPPPSHKAPQCGAFSMVKQGEPCAPFFGYEVVGKAKKSGVASLCAVSYHKNRRVSHD